jgi:hypothetical protein
VGLNPEQRKAAEMAGINLLHVEIERLLVRSLYTRSSKVRIVASYCIDLG